MTQPPDEYGDLLRRALRAEADAVVPSPEGLEIIRGRIERRGVRNLFWWRAGAAAFSAVVVAGTIVMAVPSLRSQIIEQERVTPIDVETSEKVPSNSSTTRAQQPPPQRQTPDPPRLVVPDTSERPTPRRTKKAESTSRPTPSKSPSPTPTDCPSVFEEDVEPPVDCPSSSATPTPSAEGPSVEPTECPPEECAASDEVTATPTTSADVVSPLMDTSDRTPAL